MNMIAQSAHIVTVRIVSLHLGHQIMDSTYAGRVQEVRKEEISGNEMSYVVIDFLI